jgi:TolA-binding protein
MAQAAKEARWLRGHCYFQLKQPQKAIEDLNVFLSSNPADAGQKADAQWTLALAHAELKQHQQTASHLETLLKDSPDATRADQAHYELAFAYQKLNDTDKAVQTFQALAAKFPESPLVAEAWFRVGEIHEGKSNGDEALKAFQAGLTAAKEPKFQELLLYKLGQVNYDRKAYAEAAAHWKTLIERFPQGSYRDEAVYLQAEALFDQAKFTESYPVFVQATQNPSAKHHARAHYRAGQCATQTKQWPDAEKHFQIVVDQFDKFPERTEARYGLAFAQQNQRKFDPARSQYLQIIKDTETETAARARFMLGECDFAEQKFATAWEHYLEAALGYPYEEWKAQGHYQAGRCFLQLNQPDKAREELQVVIEDHPNHALVKEAQQLLKTIP